jgi:hypothetical protein
VLDDLPMETYEVVVSYTVEVVDRAALVQAGAEHWSSTSADWAVTVEDDGVTPVDPDDVREVVPSPEAGLAWLVGAHGYPSVPGVRFVGMGVDARATSAD